jgi:hypothetical protein
MKNQKSSIDSIRKWNKIMEKVWFYIALLATVTSLVIGFVDKWQGVLTYFLLTGLAWGIFLVRRGVRIKLEKSSN